LPLDTFLLERLPVAAERAVDYELGITRDEDLAVRLEGRRRHEIPVFADAGAGLAPVPKEASRLPLAL
jgi:hypothetical protein